MTSGRRDSKRKTVVITGASAGVGRAAVRRFAAGGYNVGLIARGHGGLDAAEADVKRRGGRALVLPCDVSDAKAVENAAEQVEQHLGPIDVWVNDAMTSVFSPVKEMKAEEYKRVTDVTYLGCVNGTLAALHHMLPRDRGTIVQVGSALAYRSIPLQSAYCAAKHALVGFTDSLRCELLHDQSNVHVTVVHIPAVNTPQFGWVKSRLPQKAQPVPPIFQPEVAADALYWSAHHRRRELWVGGSTVKVMLAQKLVPGLADHYLARTGYQAQQTGKPVDEDRPDNLWQPLDNSLEEDRGAHGDFDDRASATSAELELAKYRPWITACLAGIGTGMGLALLAGKGGASGRG